MSSKSEMDRILGNPEHVIMSQDLENTVRPETKKDQTLLLDGEGFVCTLRGASLLQMKTRTWQFCLEVPGLDFSDICDVKNIQFRYGKRIFSELEGLEFESENLGTTQLSLTLSDIVNTEESES